MIYQNFDLEIISPKGSDRLCARVLDSPQGDCPFIDVKWPFNQDEENVLLSEIYGGLRQRHGRSSQASTIQDFGGKLFDAVFSGDIEHLFRSSLESSSRIGKGLRLRLRLPEDSELHVRPWEFLFDTESREFLAVGEHTPLVRYLPGAQPIPPITVEGPLRVLVAMSSPTDHPRLDISREWDILRNALEPPISSGRLELRRVPGRCTFDNLRDSLRHFGAHIFHFVGHGMPGALVLEQASGKGLEMEATQLRSAFPSGALPRLIVLNACSGAITQDVPFSGLAQGFLRQGVPAVVAMQASITDDAALIFTRYFYRDLIEIGAVDASLTEARLRMQGNGHPIEWGTPVLYMRALSGQLFQPAPNPIEWEKPTEAQEKASLSRIEPSLGERRKAKESPEPQKLPALDAGVSPSERKKPRTARVKESKPRSPAGPDPDEQNAPQKTQAKAPPSPLKPEPAAAPAADVSEQDLTEDPDPTELNILPYAVASEPTPPPPPTPPPMLQPDPAMPDSTPKAQVWEFTSQPGPEPPPAEKIVPPKLKVRKHTAPPRQEPTQAEQDIPAPAPAKESGPIFVLEPEGDAQSVTLPWSVNDAPPTQLREGRQPASARRFLVPGLAAGLVVAVLGVTVGRDHIFSPGDKPQPAPAPVAEPAPGAGPYSGPAPATGPAVEPAPFIPHDEAPIAGREGDQASPAPDAQATPPVAKRNQAADASRKPQRKPRPPPAATGNCNSPDISERDASCLFKN